jgi:hypothetical protein
MQHACVSPPLTLHLRDLYRHDIYDQITSRRPFTDRNYTGTTKKPPAATTILAWADARRDIRQHPQLHFRSPKNFLAVMCSRAAALCTASPPPPPATRPMVTNHMTREALHHVKKSASLHHQLASYPPIGDGSSDPGTRFTVSTGLHHITSRPFKRTSSSLPRHHDLLLTYIRDRLDIRLDTRFNIALNTVLQPNTTTQYTRTPSKVPEDLLNSTLS